MDERDAIAARVIQNANTPGGGPWTLEVYPTLRCNLSCQFCDTTDRHRKPQNELSGARWSQIIDEAADLGTQRIMVLGGGEPLLAEAAQAIFSRAKERGLTGFLTTNGTRLARFAPLLAQIGWDEVHVSIDGANANTHDRLRGQSGAFRQSVSGLCALRGLTGAPRLGIHTVVNHENLDELADIVRLGAALGCARVEFDHLIAYRPEQLRLALRPGDQPRLEAAVTEALATARTLAIETTAEALLRPRGLATPPPAPGLGLAAAPCLKAWHHLVIQADGRVSPCCVLAGEGGPIGAGGAGGAGGSGGPGGSVGAVWQNDPFLQSVRTSMLQKTPLPRCRECSENILVHERAIRDRLPNSPQVAGQVAGQAATLREPA